MINATDLLFLAGLTAIVIGGWHTGLGAGVASTGAVLCVGALVAKQIQTTRRRKQ